MIPNEVQKHLKDVLPLARSLMEEAEFAGLISNMRRHEAQARIDIVLELLDNQPPAPESELVINEYQISAGGINDLDDVRLCRRRQLEGPDKWAIYKRGWVMNRDGEWEYEPLPSSRDDDFLARCRFDTPDEALAVYRRTQGGPYAA